ncbi:hypothetical protein RHGRI_002692 [Rhododendron griersonianum]|uniref:Enoyl reductase (ER) domain-containing protein n=1 Tax=Rhododendron griersonianum TaxID=479676 RepID=A0AAV6LQJ0_9ERIC|nr:hypothetical protein RHGRI_002692 [Rhododendron griersonianum]
MVLVLLNFVFSAVTAITNLLSRLILTATACLLVLVIQALKLSGGAMKVAIEQLSAFAESFFVSLVEGIGNIFSTLFDLSKERISNSADAIGSALGVLMEQTGNSVVGLLNGLALVFEGFVGMVSTIITDLWNNLMDATGYERERERSCVYKLKISGNRNMARKLMHAVQYNSYGGGAAGLKHVEVPIPAPSKDEVLIKVEAASINPFDCKIQAGVARPILPRKFPFIPVNDVAGEVVEVGSGIKNFKAGDKVVSMLKSTGGGGLAEFCVAKGNRTVPRPPEVSAAEAAGLPIAALTAHMALTQFAGVKLDGSGPEKNILVTAASGGVGHYAVQLAKLGNTHVTATCGARNIEFVKSLGADEVLDYKTPDGAALRSPSGRKYDAVVHGTTGIPWSTFEPNLSENGKAIDLSPGPRTMVTFALKKLTCSKKQIVPLLLDAKVENLDYLVKLVKEGKLKTVIDSKYPLSKAEDAWAKSIDGHATGKIIVEP